MKSAAVRVAAMFGFLAVALGAFGAHGLRTTLEATGRAANWETAAHYHLIHAAILLVLALREPFARLPFTLFAVGITIFSGSLYVLALTNLKWLGAVTLLGGLCLLGGWLTLLIRPDAGTRST